MKAMIKKIVFGVLVLVGISLASPSMQARAILFYITSGGGQTTSGHAEQTGGDLDGTFSFRCNGSVGTCYISLGDGLFVGNFLVGNQNDPMPYGDAVGEYVMDVP